MLLQARDVAKTYRMDRVEVQALRGVSLAVEPGEFLVIFGPSGSGKSTLLQILGLLDRPSRGTFLFEGRDVSTLGDRDLSAVRNRRVGFVFQAFHLLPGYTARQNIELPLHYARFGAAERDRRVAEAAEQVGIAARLSHRPVELSGGERQRVAIARALVCRPAVLLADEPTGNLDSASGLGVLEVFRELHRAGTTVALVTHNLDLARFATRCVTLRDGLLHDGGA
ncbi:MAG: ABC transporter ATP-binding protein [Planctomycetes bacterium]|nr:ABC transporter ATP-binding protein [Planctomycetota bacterium]